MSVEQIVKQLGLQHIGEGGQNGVGQGNARQDHAGKDFRRHLGQVGILQQRGEFWGQNAGEQFSPRRGVQSEWRTGPGPRAGLGADAPWLGRLDGNRRGGWKNHSVTSMSGVRPDVTSMSRLHLILHKSEVVQSSGLALPGCLRGARTKYDPRDR